MADNGKGSSFISLLQSTTSNRVTPRHWSPGIATDLYTYPIQLSVDLADNGKGSSFISLLQSTTSNRVTPRHCSPGIATDLYTYPIQLSVDLADSGKGSSFISLLQSKTSNRVTPRHWSPGIAVNTYQVLQINRVYTRLNKKGALAIRHIFSLVDMITKPKFSNCPNVFKIGLFR